MNNAAEVTLFLVSAGYNPNYFDTLAALKSQTLVKNGRAIIEVIRNVAPMSAAFQQMLDTCKTPYYAQIDEDMVLEADAAEVLLDLLKRDNERATLSAGQAAFAVAMLHDCHLNMPIQGVKLYDHSVMVNYPYRVESEVISCEKDQLERLRADGCRIVERLDVILGEHAPKWTTQGIFIRYFRLMAKWRQYGYSWLENMPAKLLGKYQQDPSEINLYAFLGAQSAASHPNLKLSGEDDYRKIPREYLVARSWFSKPTQATLYITDRCNLKCGWCLRQGDMAQVSPAPDFSPEIIDELMVRCPAITAVCLCGFGDPLLHPNLAAIIDRCKRFNLWAGLITNGTLLGQKFGMLLEHRPSSLSISLNAASAAEHEAECGVAGAWDSIMHGLDLIRDWRRTMRGMQSQDRGIPIFLSRVCTVDNLDGIPDFLQLAMDLGVIDGVDLHNVLPHDVGTPEKTAEFLGRVLTVAHWQQVESLKSLPGARLVRSWPTLIDPDHPSRRCAFPFTALSVDGARRVGFCNSVMPPREDGPTIRDPKVWQSDAAQSLRLSFADPEIPDWCKHCFRNFC
jgi:hypothetical protein